MNTGNGGRKSMNTDQLIRSNRRLVLIVEDEAVNREILSMILSPQYDVLCAENGRDALAVIREKKDRLSMILLDINMPVMNGTELLKILSADEELRAIPVIVLTSDKNAELESLELGALDFIMKPYDMPQIILARVKRIIEFVEDRQIIRDVELDELTGLYNRGFFCEYSRHLLSGRPGEEWDLIAVNIDRFRVLNEVYGKSFGDQALCAIADGIREGLASHFGISCRSDADLFFALAQHHPDAPRQMLSLINDRLDGLERKANIRVRMGVYRGVTAGGQSIEWCCDAGKAACNALRNHFGTSVMVYDEALYEKERMNQRLMSDLDEGISRRQFRVFFQPKYNITGDKPRLSGAEALVRWQHPELGFISPGAFIPLFEENGLIAKVDEFVWRETARQISAWREKYGFVLPVSVNLSRMDLFDDSLLPRLEGIVREHGIRPRDFLLEVTESAYAENTEQMIAKVDGLRRAGFRIEMDDFGSGYSSLNMLCLMPIDALKVDMKFVQNLIGADSGAHILELVMDMAHSLRLPAVVEGVEDAQQCQLVKQAGADVIQGFFFSRPVDAQSFEQLIEKDLAEVQK